MQKINNNLSLSEVCLADQNNLPDPSKGFNDPRSPYSEQPEYAGTPSYGPYPVDGFEVTMPSGHDLGESDTSRLAQGEGSESHDKLIERRTNRQTSIQTATQPYLPTVSDEAVQEDRGSFDEPHPKDIDYNKKMKLTMEFIVLDYILTIMYLNLSLDILQK